MVLRAEMGIDKDKVSVERRYSDFRALYKSLKKDLPTILKDINFPKRVLGQKSNLDPELIESRRVEFQAFLQTIYQHYEVRQHPAFREFFYLPGLREATDFLIGGELNNSLELLLNSLHLQVKLCDKVREVIATLAAVLVVLEAQDNLEDAEHYAMAALDLAQDDYLCSYVIPLLDTAVKLRQKLQMDKKGIENHLFRVQRMTGLDVDHMFSLRALVAMRFQKEKTSS